MFVATALSNLDARAKCWQVNVDETSFIQYLLATIFAPFGVHCASEMSSTRVSEILEGLELRLHAENIVFGTYRDIHDNNSSKLLERIKD